MREEIKGVFIGKCPRCNADIWLPRELCEAAKASEDVAFFCGYGHRLHLPRNESELAKVKRERDFFKAQLELYEEKYP